MRSIHELRDAIGGLPPPVRALAERLLLVRHERVPATAARVTRVYHRWLEEATTFDERRRRRMPDGERLARLREHCRSEPGCAFCGAARARIVARPGAREIEGGVLFPPDAAFAKHHCLVFPDEHDPLALRPLVVERMFAAAERWALAVEDEEEPPFYFVTWNILCGSVIHGHLQATLNAQFAEGGVERLARIGREYAARHGADFFGDTILLHDELGLAVRQGRAVAFASLTPVRENELWIVQAADRPAHLPEDLQASMVAALRGIAAMGEPCRAFNIGVAFPPLRPMEGWDDFPVVARIVDRGWPLLGVADWAAMEMFGTRVVSSDPCALARQLG